MTTRGPAESTHTETAPPTVVMCKQCGLRECYLDRAGWATPVCFVCIQGTPQATQNIASGLAATRAALKATRQESNFLRGRATAAEATVRVHEHTILSVSTQRDDLATAYNDEVNAHATTEARATAVEGERDRLREALTVIAEQSGCCRQCVGVARAALAAIPHTEGEASAPPKENP